jgi:flagellar motility protein MotE (MotC chaperone)
MSRSLKVLSVGVILFSVAASASWYLQWQQPRNEEEKSAKPAPANPRAKADAPETAAPRPLARPAPSPEADRFTQLAAALQGQQESLRNREQHVVVREKQMNLIHDEIKKEHKKLDLVRKDIEGELALVQEKLDLLERRAGETDKVKQRAAAELEETKRLTIEMTGTETKNLKLVSGIYDKMDAEAGALSIQQMVDKGNMDTAVTILTGMRDRQAANLLGEISKQEPSLAAQLFERMRFVKTPASPAKKSPE